MGKTHSSIVEFQSLHSLQSVDGGIGQVTIQHQLVDWTGPLRVEVTADDVSPITSCHAHHFLDGARNLGNIGNNVKTHSETHLQTIYRLIQRAT